MGMHKSFIKLFELSLIERGCLLVLFLRLRFIILVRIYVTVMKHCIAKVVQSLFYFQTLCTADYF